MSTNQVILITGDRIGEVDRQRSTELQPTHVFGNGPDFETLILRQTYLYCTEMACL